MQRKAAISSQEVRAFLIILAGGVISNTYPMYHSIGETVRTAFFQVESIITTTGYSTTDFDLWPELSKCILVMLMFIEPAPVQWEVNQGFANPDP